MYDPTKPARARYLPGLLDVRVWAALAGILLAGLLWAVPAVPAAEMQTVALSIYPAKGRTALKDYAGKVVLVNFWAPWCVPCREEFPELQSLQAKFAGGGLVVLGVTAEEDPKKIARFLDKVPVSFPILQDNASTLHQAVDVEVMPSTLLLDRHGRVVKVYTGFTRERGLTEMEHDIAALIGSKS